MGDPILYAKVDGPPADWACISIFDRDTSEFVDGVIEVDVAAGWLVRYRKDEAGNFLLQGEEVATERLTGRFALIRHPRGT